MRMHNAHACYPQEKWPTLCLERAVMQKVIQAKYGHLRTFNPVANFANSNDSAERMQCTATGGVTTPRDRPFPRFGYLPVDSTPKIELGIV